MLIAKSIYMARLARVVVPDIPHHVTQRGNRRQMTFFDTEDYQEYLKCMRQTCTQYGVKIWSYCLMPNHIHLIVVPSSSESLAKAIGRGHESYTRYINFKKKWRGYLWQGRFSSFPMDDGHLYECMRYVELNPIRAKLVEAPEQYRWSSARAHMKLVQDNILDDVDLVISKVEDWKKYLLEAVQKDSLSHFKKHENSGRPLGSIEFLKNLEAKLGIQVIPRKPGPKSKMI